MLLRQTGGVGFNAKQADTDQHFLSINGITAPCLRAADSTSGRATAAVIRACPSPPATIYDTFAHVTRLAETDGAPANAKAERMLQAWLKKASHKHSNLHHVCAAHKCHAIADKVWEQDLPTLSGIVAALLTVQKSQPLSRLREALLSLVQTRAQVLTTFQPLTEAAKRYRSNILNLYAPTGQHTRKRSIALAMAAVFNHDWRSRGVVVHACPGPHCCSDRQEGVEKMLYMMKVFLRSLRPGKLCKGNWLAWMRPLQFLGLLGAIHNILADAFEIAFKKTGAERGGQDCSQCSRPGRPRKTGMP